MKRNCLAIITARGGSKGVPRKNIRMLNNRPMISYTIECALQTAEIDLVMVTTDSEEIRQAAIALGAEVPFLRPSELATDTSRQEDAVLHAMDWYEGNEGPFDLICLLEPTVPLRRSSTLSEGFDLLARSPSYDAVFSVTEAEQAPVWTNTLADDGSLKGFINEEYLWLNRQDLPTYYDLTPVVTISRWGVFKERETFLHDKTIALVTDPIESLDVDTPLDFFILEQLMKHGLTTSSQLEGYVGR